MKILIVEDEQELVNDLREYLKNEGYLIEVAYTSREAKDKIFIHQYDVLLLDIGLPDSSGLDVLRYLKEHKPETGVLILSARNALQDKIDGLDLGADDYLTKPFHHPELNSRIKSIIRRRNFAGNSTIQFEDIVINPDNMEVSVKGKSIVLTRKEYELLLYMITNKGRVLTKESIVEHLWGDDSDMFGSFDFIYSHIKNLRKKIVEAGGADYLKSVYGLGYKFEAD